MSANTEEHELKPDPKELYVRGPEPSADEYAGEVERARRLAQRYRLEFVDMEQFPIDHELFRAIPADLMLRYGFVPYKREGQTLVIVVSDPTDLPMIDELALLLAMPVRRHGGVSIGDPGDPKKKRELAARPRGRH